MEDSRYPYTYACDLIRRWAGYNNEGTKLYRSDASKIRSEIAKTIGMDDAKLACLLADRFLENRPEDKASEGLVEFLVNLTKGGAV